MKTYTGKCHCGKVTYSAESDLTSAIECNCSHCGVKGLVLNFIPNEQFILHSGEQNLKKYTFNKHVIDHLFCENCGVETFAFGKDKDGKEMVALNIRSLEEVDTDSIPKTKFNGKNY